jgi:hypothetical protein
MGLPSNTCELLQVFLNMSLELCEARDPKGLYKLARAGKIKGKVHMMLGVQNGNSLECLVLPAEQNWIKLKYFKIWVTFRACFVILGSLPNE